MFTAHSHTSIHMPWWARTGMVSGWCSQLWPIIACLLEHILPISGIGHSIWGCEIVRFYYRRATIPRFGLQLDTDKVCLDSPIAHPQSSPMRMSYRVSIVSFSERLYHVMIEPHSTNRNMVLQIYGPMPSGPMRIINQWIMNYINVYMDDLIK